MSEIRTGTIKEIITTPGSGGITIEFEDGTQVFADNGPTIRSFDSMFEDVITEGGCFDPEKIIGKKIRYSLTDYGTMDSMEDAEIIPIYEINYYLTFSTQVEGGITPEDEQEAQELFEEWIHGQTHDELIAQASKSIERIA